MRTRKTFVSVMYSEIAPSQIRLTSELFAVGILEKKI
jgi:hypothetical protein